MMVQQECVKNLVGVTRREFMGKALWSGGGLYAVLSGLHASPFLRAETAEATEYAPLSAEERTKLIEETAELAKFNELNYYG